MPARTSGRSSRARSRSCGSPTRSAPHGPGSATRSARASGSSSAACSTAPSTCSHSTAAACPPARPLSRSGAGSAGTQTGTPEPERTPPRRPWSGRVRSSSPATRRRYGSWRERSRSRRASSGSRRSSPTRSRATRQSCPAISPRSAGATQRSRIAASCRSCGAGSGTCSTAARSRATDRRPSWRPTSRCSTAAFAPTGERGSRTARWRRFAVASSSSASTWPPSTCASTPVTCVRATGGRGRCSSGSVACGVVSEPRRRARPSSPVSAPPATCSPCSSSPVTTDCARCRCSRPSTTYERRRRSSRSCSKTGGLRRRDVSRSWSATPTRARTAAT